jgi:low temperature requirement protein LtrA
MTDHAAAPRRLLRRMAPRDPHEAHRFATPLELLFDLCFVVAVAQAAAQLHHGLGHGHAAEAVRSFVLVFFAIWWAWMNFTWFASAYDCDDVPYRLLVLLQIGGVLVIAAGVPAAAHGDFAAVTAGYAIMRVGLITLWLRAAGGDPARRQTALRMALGVTLVEVGWLVLLLVPATWWIVGWFVMAPAEMLVPMWAERAGQTPWHAHHVTERYGLLTLIVLGESILAATVAAQSALAAGAVMVELGSLVVGSLLIVFSMWWLYFDHPVHHRLTTLKRSFAWGYGHFFLFGAVAAVGAGLAVASDVIVGKAHLHGFAAGAPVGVPVAIYLVMVWALLVRPATLAMSAAYLGTALAVVAVSALHGAPLLIGGLVAALVVFTTWAERGRPAPSH